MTISLNFKAAEQARQGVTSTTAELDSYSKYVSNLMSKLDGDPFTYEGYVSDEERENLNKLKTLLRDKAALVRSEIEKIKDNMTSVSNQVAGFFEEQRSAESTHTQKTEGVSK